MVVVVVVVTDDGDYSYSVDYDGNSDSDYDTKKMVSIVCLKRSEHIVGQCSTRCLNITGISASSVRSKVIFCLC